MIYTVRPISDRTWLGSMGSEPTRFSAKWSETLSLLGFEIEKLSGRDVVIECDVTEGDLRLDGTLRANARPTSDAVVVAFESRHGPMLYRCDRFRADWSHQGPGWHHNVRAIALTLQALRAVDRYGATQTGQQYAGFKQLPAGRAMPASHMTSDEAAHIIRSYADHHGGDYDLQQLVKRARFATHPDRHGGGRAAWDKVEEAAKVLGVIG